MYVSSTPLSHTGLRRATTANALFVPTWAIRIRSDYGQRINPVEARRAEPNQIVPEEVGIHADSARKWRSLREVAKGSSNRELKYAAGSASGDSIRVVLGAVGSASIVTYEHFIRAVSVAVERGAIGQEVRPRETGSGVRYRRNR